MCGTNRSVGRFTGQLTASDPLQTLFQLLSGRIPAVATVQHHTTQSPQFHLSNLEAAVSARLVSC